MSLDISLVTGIVGNHFLDIVHVFRNLILQIGRGAADAEVGFGFVHETANFFDNVLGVCPVHSVELLSNFLDLVVSLGTESSGDAGCDDGSTAGGHQGRAEGGVGERHHCLKVFEMNKRMDRRVRLYLCN